MEIEKTLSERGKIYGSFVSESEIDQAIKAVLHHSPNWDKMPDYMKTAFEMLSVKLSRILNGDMYYLDSYTDIVGYTTLVMKAVERFSKNFKQEREK